MVCIRDSLLKKYAPLMREELTHKDDIDEVLYPLKESDTDYITKMCEKPTPLGVGWIAQR